MAEVLVNLWRALSTAAGSQVRQLTRRALPSALDWPYRRAVSVSWEMFCEHSCLLKCSDAQTTLLLTRSTIFQCMRRLLVVLQNLTPGSAVSRCASSGSQCSWRIGKISVRAAGAEAP